MQGDSHELMWFLSSESVEPDPRGEPRPCRRPSERSRLSSWTGAARHRPPLHKTSGTRATATLALAAAGIALQAPAPTRLARPRGWRLHARFAAGNRDRAARRHPDQRRRSAARIAGGDSHATAHAGAATQRWAPPCRRSARSERYGDRHDGAGGQSPPFRPQSACRVRARLACWTRQGDDPCRMRTAP
jgi:hypothetical protein